MKPPNPTHSTSTRKSKPKFTSTRDLYFLSFPPNPHNVHASHHPHCSRRLPEARHPCRGHARRNRHDPQHRLRRLHRGQEQVVSHQHWRRYCQEPCRRAGQAPAGAGAGPQGPAGVQGRHGRTGPPFHPRHPQCREGEGRLLPRATGRPAEAHGDPSGTRSVLLPQGPDQRDRDGRPAD